MNGELGLAFEQRLFELLDEQPLATDGRERLVEDAIARGRDRQQFDREPGVRTGQQLGDVAALPQGQLARPGRDTQRAPVQHASRTQRRARDAAKCRAGSRGMAGRMVKSGSRGWLGASM
jgi:hypothetical protein